MMKHTKVCVGSEISIKIPIILTWIFIGSTDIFILVFKFSKQITFNSSGVDKLLSISLFLRLIIGSRLSLTS